MFLVGVSLFSQFYLPFEAISLLLVAAMVGAVVVSSDGVVVGHGYHQREQYHRAGISFV